MVKQTRRLKMAERAQQQMDFLFPNMPKEWIWQRQTHDGYASVPRTLPIVMEAIDKQSKGQPAGHALFCLWARSPDHPLVTIEHPATFASEAGFQGERAVDTWRRRMKKLKELGFILTKEGPTGEFHFVLLLNPNAAVELMWHKKLVQEVLYTRFHSRVLDIGAYKDIEQIHELWSRQHQARLDQEQQEGSPEQGEG